MAQTHIIIFFLPLFHLFSWLKVWLGLTEGRSYTTYAPRFARWLELGTMCLNRCDEIYEQSL